MVLLKLVLRGVVSSENCSASDCPDGKSCGGRLVAKHPYSLKSAANTPAPTSVL